MPNTRIYDRLDREALSALQGSKHAPLTSGVGELAQQDDDSIYDVSSILAQFKEVSELGRPGVAIAISADLSAESKITVPTGKYWRIIGGFLQYTASADAATRTPIITLEDGADNAYETFTLTTKVANDVENDHFLAGTDGNVEGTEGVAAQGTLTLAVNPTAGDTMTIDSIVYTFVAAAGSGTPRDIEIGGTLAVTKTNVEAVLVDGDHPTVNAVAFATDDMVLTARNKGTAGDAIVTTETFTSGSNIFDDTTLGGTTAGVDEANAIAASLDYPTVGILLDGGDEIDLNVTSGHANDTAELAIFFIEFDHDPSA